MTLLNFVVGEATASKPRSIPTAAVRGWENQQWIKIIGNAKRFMAYDIVARLKEKENENMLN